MADYVLHVASPLAAGACFAALSDWDRHEAAIPLTRLVHDGPARVGQRFVARTGLGRLAFDDVMVVRSLRPPSGDHPGDSPGVCDIAKTGRIVGGRVTCTVTPSATGSAVEWAQSLTIPWLPVAFDRLVGAVGRRAYRLALRRILAAAEDPAMSTARRPWFRIR